MTLCGGLTWYTDNVKKTARGSRRAAGVLFSWKEGTYITSTKKKHEQNQQNQQGHYWETEEYKAFTDKFKPKLTTDDCFTPPAVYEVVKDWAVEHYGLQGRPIVRPFYPGGDFEHFNYPADCVVIDNPPFSIGAKIIDFYLERGIAFFLFAQNLTLFSTARGRANAVIANGKVTYENGAVVSTSFLTSLGDYLVETAPDLAERIKEAQKDDKPSMPKYDYPANLITAALLNKAVNLGIHFRVKKGTFVRVLDCQREKKKTIYGGGYLIPTKDAEMLRTEMLRTEMLRTEMLRTEMLRTEMPATVWELSERERQLIAMMDKEAEREEEKEARHGESEAALSGAEA